MSRNLFYTAVTRARKLVVLVGNEIIMRRMVDQDRQAERFTALDTMLLEGRKADCDGDLHQA